MMSENFLENLTKIMEFLNFMTLGDENLWVSWHAFLMERKRLLISELGWDLITFHEEIGLFRREVLSDSGKPLNNSILFLVFMILML